jgi:predicted DNA-binding transcriptional regulator
MSDEHHRSRLILERISRVVEDRPGSDARTIRARAGVPRRSGDDALALLLSAGFVNREQVNAEWSYHSVKPYRVNNEAPRATYGQTHAARQGGGG